MARCPFPSAEGTGLEPATGEAGTSSPVRLLTNSDTLRKAMSACRKPFRRRSQSLSLASATGSFTTASYYFRLIPPAGKSNVRRFPPETRRSGQTDQPPLYAPCSTAWHTCNASQPAWSGTSGSPLPTTERRNARSSSRYIRFQS